ncbi:MAG: hypothetical protein GW803_04690 [Caldiserica bacterium]|nr:hypothetical protein [Caldisericota bacterium]NCQ53355.1 hypothetical protein [Caldisericota bacterium]
MVVMGFDVTNNELFNVYSYKDAEKEFRPMGIPSYNIISEKNILVIDLTANSKEGTLMNKVIFYDLVSRKIIKEIGGSVYKRQYTIGWGLPIDLIDGCMYGERFYIDNNKNISGQYILSDIVKLNLNTFAEEVVFQRTPFRLLATASLGKIILAPYINNYPFHDIWIWDTKEGKIECYLKVSLEGSINPLDDMKPYISFCNSAGFLYTNSSNQLLEERYTFFSLKENKAYFTTPIQFILDNGEYAIIKSVYDLFSTPPFDYPGKEEKLKGCKTYLIIKPE